MLLQFSIFHFPYRILFFILKFIAQLLSCVLLFATPQTATCQASLSFTLSQSLLKYMADIDQYPDFANYRVVPIPPIEIPHVPTFDVIKFTTKNAFLPDGVPFNEPD